MCHNGHQAQPVKLVSGSDIRMLLRRALLRMSEPKGRSILTFASCSKQSPLRMLESKGPLANLALTLTFLGRGVSQDRKERQRAHHVENLSFALLSVAGSCPDSEVRGLSLWTATPGRFGFFRVPFAGDIRQSVSRALVLALFFWTFRHGKKWRSLLLLRVTITCAYL